MVNIKKFLIDSGYDTYELENVIEGNNEFLHVLITKKMKKNTLLEMQLDAALTDGQIAE